MQGIPYQQKHMGNCQLGDKLEEGVGGRIKLNQNGFNLDYFFPWKPKQNVRKNLSLVLDAPPAKQLKMHTSGNIPNANADLDKADAVV